MGGKGSGRKPEPKTPIASTSEEDFFIPNLSGDHTAGHTSTPTDNLDIANKSYVDAQVVDWTISQAPAVIHAANYTDTGDTTAHASFTQLDYASAGHTGFAPALGADDNYVTDAEKTVIGNTSGANTGDQDISGIGTNTTAIALNTTHRGDATGGDHSDVVTAVGLNTAKDTNVSTDLSAGTRAPTTIDVNSSDGANATLVEADTTNAGILGSDKWDEIVANTAAKHTQNTDTALGSGAVAADHGTAATDQVVNVCYGTGDPPAANTTTEGSLFVKYTA